MSVSKSPRTWLRLAFRWSNSLQTWHERTADIALLCGIVLAGVLTWMVSPGWWQTILLWLGCLAPALVLSRMGWLKVFGPVLYYDMIRQARRGRFIVLRFGYALLLVFVLLCVAGDVVVGKRITADDGARIAQDYFEVFMVAQFITVVLLTPAYVAGAIAEEKDRKTLEFMLATDLLNREIVLSKLGSRMANLALVVLTGLPILSTLQFLGGVDPNLVAAGFAVTAITIVGLAGVSILCSVLTKKPRDAIVLAYLIAIVYYAATLMLWITSRSPYGSIDLWFTPDVFTLTDLVQILNAGNLIALIGQVKSLAGTGSLAAELPWLVGGYALFYGLVACGCSALAIARLRRVALEQSSAPALRAGKGPAANKPEIGVFPMLWKEIHCERVSRRGALALVVNCLLLALAFAPAALIVGYHWYCFYEPVDPMYGNGLREAMNGWVRICNVVVGSLLLLGVAVRASTTFTSERDKQTWDALLTTPLDSSALMHAKWVGSILSARWGIVWLALIWGLAIATGGMHPLAIPFVLVSWFIYAAFLASMGIWFSISSKTSQRATVLTILSTIGLGVGHWLPWMCCAFAPTWAGAPSRDLEHLSQAQLGILTPPFVLYWAPFTAEDFRRPNHDDVIERLTLCSLIGLIFWSVAAAGLYGLAATRLRFITHRGVGLKPDLLRADVVRGRPGWAALPPGPSSSRADQSKDDELDNVDSLGGTP